MWVCSVSRGIQTPRDGEELPDGGLLQARQA